MNKADAQHAQDLATPRALSERANNKCPGMIAMIESEIELQKETAIARPAVASECRGAVNALRRLLMLTDPTVDDETT